MVTDAYITSLSALDSEGVFADAMCAEYPVDVMRIDLTIEEICLELFILKYRLARLETQNDGRYSGSGDSGDNSYSGNSRD